MEGNTTQVTPPKSTTGAKGFDFGASFKQSLTFIKNVFVKPVTKGDEDVKAFSDGKTTAFFAAVSIIAVTLIHLLTTILQTVVTRTYKFFGASSELKIDFGRLENMDFFKTIGDGLLYGIAIVAILAVVSYVLALVMGKKPSFTKLVGIASSCIVPLYAMMFVGAIVAIMNTNISYVFNFIGLAYAGAIAFRGINKEVGLEGEKNVYFNTILATTIFSIAYYTLINTIESSVTNLFNF